MFWRSQVRALLAGGGDLAAMDPLLEITGPPDVPLKGISSEVRTELVTKAVPNFMVHTWQTRMWTCLKIELPTPPGNTGEATAYPVGTYTMKRTCPQCGAYDGLEMPVRWKAKITPDTRLRTFQRRVRMARAALDLPTINAPLALCIRPGDASFGTFLAWRVIAEEFVLTTDHMMDLDNLIKGLLDAVQGAKGTPGLLHNDRLGHVLLAHRAKMKS